jgi:hypothetical protein
VGKLLWVSDFTLWFGYSLYKSSKFQPSTSSRSGLAFLDKHKTLTLGLSAFFVFLLFAILAS